MKDQSPQDLVNELQKLLTSNELPKDVKRQAYSVAHQLWRDLEVPGDIVKRMIFQVGAPLFETVGITNR